MLNWRLYNNPLRGDQLVADFNHDWEITEAAFSTTAVGGFAEGRLSLADPDIYAVKKAVNEWLTCRVVATDGAGTVVYEGFVQGIEGRFDQFVSRFSCDSFANYVLVRWVDSLEAAHLSSYSEPNSISLYGRIVAEENVSSQGPKVQSDIDSWGATYTAENKAVPLYDYDSGGRDRKISLSLYGYWASLQWGYYGQQDANTELRAIAEGALNGSLVGPPQQYVRKDYDYMFPSGTTINYWTGSNANDIIPAQRAISDLCKYGSSTNRRMLFQVLGNRMPWFFPIPTTPRYVVNTLRPDRIADGSGSPIPAYLVRAGGHALVENLLMASSGNFDVDIVNNPRATEIERTSYDDIAGVVRTSPRGKRGIPLLLGNVVTPTV